MKKPSSRKAEIKAFEDEADAKVKTKKVGNPREAKTKTVSFSLPFDVNDSIDEKIKELAKDGFIGVTRSDIAVAALQLQMTKNAALIKQIKKNKGI